MNKKQLVEFTAEIVPSLVHTHKRKKTKVIEDVLKGILLMHRTGLERDQLFHKQIKEHILVRLVIGCHHKVRRSVAENVKTEMSVGGFWCRLVPNQRFLVIYHHLSCYAVYSQYQFSVQPLFYSDISPLISKKISVSTSLKMLIVRYALVMCISGVVQY